VDEYRLMVFPIVLGTGKRLFGEGTSRTVLRLVDATPVGPDGVIILTYEPAR
jgi:dihydrofolate reductase